MLICVAKNIKFGFGTSSNTASNFTIYEQPEILVWWSELPSWYDGLRDKKACCQQTMEWASQQWSGESSLDQKNILLCLFTHFNNF